ncbi:MAG TPA: OsmC family peroxiredoxin [Polyangiaceae bacterium]|nr:OsmC family peroxiredoxin [Polyangiaceae bacterium]
MTVSKAQATWTGTLKEGNGSVKGGNGYFEAPFTYATRFEGASQGTTPEELIGAAQAGCFSMFLAAQLSKEGHTPKRIDTTALVHLEAGPTITKIELETTADVPGVDESLFQDKVQFSKQNCPVSKALSSVPEIVVRAKLAAR